MSTSKTKYDKFMDFIIDKVTAEVAVTILVVLFFIIIAAIREFNTP